MPTTVSLGSTGDDVKRVQRVLARMLAYNPFGPITGIFDATLETSVKSFQEGAGLTPDGIVGPATWAALPAYREASPTLQLGSTGPVVAWLQQTLAQAITGSIAPPPTPYAGPIDGIYGSETEAAVQSLQTWAGHTADGVVADNTWFIWMRPGSASQLTLEDACGLLNGLR
jgi:peptidoglycan hydrolase-like protein with peptidoglycan-binding domain